MNYISSKLSDQEEQDINDTQINDPEINICKQNDLLEEFLETRKCPRLLRIDPWNPLKTTEDLVSFLESTKHFKTYDPKYGAKKEFIYNCLLNYKLLGLSCEDAFLLKNYYFKDVAQDNNLNESSNIKIIDFTKNDYDSEDDLLSDLENEEEEIEEIDVVDNLEDINNIDDIPYDEIKNSLYDDNSFIKPSNIVSLPDTNNQKNDISKYLRSQNEILKTTVAVTKVKKMNEEEKSNDELNQHKETDNFKKIENGNSNKLLKENIKIIELQKDMNNTSQLTTYEKYRPDKNNSYEGNFGSLLPSSYVEDQHNKYTKIDKPYLAQLNKAKKTKTQIENVLVANYKQNIDVDKKLEIIRYMKLQDIDLTAELFDITDEKNNLIITDEEINKWYIQIKKLEQRKTRTFDISTLLIMISLYGVEWMAKRFNITELSTLCSDLNFESMPHHLLSSKDYLDNYISNKVPNNPALDLVWFIVGTYTYKKTGLNLINLTTK